MFMKSRTGRVVVIGSVLALLTCTIAVLAEIGTELRVRVVDSAGADLTSAVVARVTDNGKLEAGKRLDKSTWVFESLNGKVLLSVRDGRSGGIVEILIPANASLVTFEV